MDDQTKPFSLQAPEAIAKDYGGNKQKIAEAAQMGLLDPTAAVLAGMFIDRMRAAQMQEQVPQQTVAQQVMAPPPPPAPPGMGGIPNPPQPAGLGATQEAAAMGLPAPMMPQGDPAMGAAMAPPPEAGLEALPVPDGDYAEGGLVAFAGAGEVRQPLTLPELLMQLYPKARQTSGYRGPEHELTKKNPNSWHAKGSEGDPYAIDIAPIPGVSFNDFVAAMENAGMGTLEAKEEVGANRSPHATGDHWHYAGRPGGKNEARPSSDILRRMGIDPGNGDITTTAGQLGDFATNLDFFRNLLAGEDTTQKKAIMASFMESISPEAQEKAKKRDMWESIAELGARLAASDSPYFLQAVGQATAGALPGAKESRKDREARKDAALKGLYAVEQGDREEALKLMGLSSDAAKAGATYKNAELDRDAAMARVQAQIEAQKPLLEAKIAGLNAPPELKDNLMRRAFALLPMLNEWRKAGREGYKGKSDSELLDLAMTRAAKLSGSQNQLNLGLNPQEKQKEADSGDEDEGVDYDVDAFKVEG